MDARERRIQEAVQALREGHDVADLLEIGRRISPRDDLEERVSALEARVEHLYVMRDEELMVEHDRETARTKAELAHMEATGELRLDAVPGDPEYDPAPAPPEGSEGDWRPDDLPGELGFVSERFATGGAEESAITLRPSRERQHGVILAEHVRETVQRLQREKCEAQTSANWRRHQIEAREARIEALKAEIANRSNPENWEATRQQMRDLGREVWAECLAEEGYAPTDRTPWAIPLTDMVNRHMDRLRARTQREISRGDLVDALELWRQKRLTTPEVAARLGLTITDGEADDGS
jgi:hypothetical protein